MLQTDHALFELTAEDLMSRNVVTLAPGMSLQAAAQVLEKDQIGGAPVVDSHGRCIGVLSTTDFTHPAKKKNRAARIPPAAPGCVCSEWKVVEQDWNLLPADSVGWRMTTDPVLVAPETPLGELAQKMVDAHIHRLIVVDGDRRPVGIVSSTDLLAALAWAAQVAV